MAEEHESLIPGMIEEGETKEVLVDPRVFVCSFPKAGTHLMEQLVRPLARPMPADKPWSGTFQGHSWTLRRIPVKATLQRIGWIRDGTYAKGHLGYSEIIEHYLYGIGAAVLFVYRDPRDVAVSLTHHIRDDKPHPNNEWYKDVDFDAALLAVIKGVGPYAGVMRRWNEYAGWLDVPWVLALRYGDLLAHKQEQTELILRYIVGHCAAMRGYSAVLSDEQVDTAVAAMVANSERTDKSPTFRKGGSGGWREVFKPMHVVAMHDTDREAAEMAGLEEGSWLVKLGFEDEVDWWTDWVEKEDDADEQSS